MSGVQYLILIPTDFEQKFLVSTSSCSLFVRSGLGPCSSACTLTGFLFFLSFFLLPSSFSHSGFYSIVYRGASLPLFCILFLLLHDIFSRLFFFLYSDGGGHTLHGRTGCYFSNLFFSPGDVRNCVNDLWTPQNNRCGAHALRPAWHIISCVKNWHRRFLQKPTCARCAEGGKEKKKKMLSLSLRGPIDLDETRQSRQYKRKRKEKS